MRRDVWHRRTLSLISNHNHILRYGPRWVKAEVTALMEQTGIVALIVLPTSASGSAGRCVMP